MKSKKSKGARCRQGQDRLHLLLHLCFCPTEMGFVKRTIGNAGARAVFSIDVDSGFTKKKSYHSTHRSSPAVTQETKQLCRRVRPGSAVYPRDPPTPTPTAVVTMMMFMMF